MINLGLPELILIGFIVCAFIMIGAVVKKYREAKPGEDRKRVIRLLVAVICVGGIIYSISGSYPNYMAAMFWFIVGTVGYVATRNQLS